jgi:hypothetical protein
MDKIIKIQSFNPYESVFPNRKVITIDSLILAKRFRQEGFEVQFLPLNNQPVQYIFRKGVMEFLSDPLNFTLVNIAVPIVTNIISNYVQKGIDKYFVKSLNKDKNIIILNENNSNKSYNINGEIVSQDQIDFRNSKIIETQIKFKNAFNLAPPKGYPPVPIFYEHKPEIVGWCFLKINSKGILIEEGKITNTKVRDKISKGKIKGLSVTGIATKTECSICKGDFITCPHFGEGVNNRIQKADFIEVSLVKIPINKECLVSFVR